MKFPFSCIENSPNPLEAVLGLNDREVVLRARLLQYTKLVQYSTGYCTCRSARNFSIRPVAPITPQLNTRVDVHTPSHLGTPESTRLDKSDSTVRFKSSKHRRFTAGGRAGTHTRTSQQSHNQADSYRHNSTVQKQRKLDTETGARKHS